METKTHAKMQYLNSLYTTFLKHIKCNIKKEVKLISHAFVKHCKNEDNFAILRKSMQKDAFWEKRFSICLFVYHSVHIAGNQGNGLILTKFGMNLTNISIEFFYVFEMLDCNG